MSAREGAPLPAAAAEAVATAFVRALARADWAGAVAVSAFDTPPDASPESFLRDLWAGLVDQHGALGAGRLAASAPHGAGHTVDFAVRLAAASVVLRVVVGGGARVTGFWITPPHRRSRGVAPGVPDDAE